MKKLFKSAMVFVGMMGATAALADPLPKMGTFIFSNACASPGGDFSGYRVTITRQAAMRVMIEFNDSGPDGKDIARGVKFDQASGKLDFQFKGDLPHAFHGTVGTAALQGIFDGEKLVLPLIKTVPKYLPSCDPRNSP